jgi:hypothetical protein
MPTKTIADIMGMPEKEFYDMVDDMGLMENFEERALEEFEEHDEERHEKIASEYPSYSKPISWDDDDGLFEYDDDVNTDESESE